MSRARDVALAVLTRVEKEDAFAAAALKSELQASRDERDAALATELVLGVLRTRPWLDHLLTSVSKHGLTRIKPLVMRILRLGAYQIAFLERIPHRAAVNEAVAQAKRFGNANLSGLVNALLRRLAEKSVQELSPRVDDEGAPSDELATRLGLPRWLLERLTDGHGRHRALGMARAWNRPARRTLRINVNHLAREEALKKLGKTASPGCLTPWSVDTDDWRAATALIDDGLATYQDEGSQLIVLALDAARGLRMLDACAGRGGKTSAMAMVSDGKSEITASDKNAAKLERMEFELGRQGFRARASVADLTTNRTSFEGPFDRILLDAPCTGTGTLGRRPEIRWRLEPEAVSSLVTVQEGLLDKVVTRLAPGGRMIYAVCSVLPEEGMDHVDAFLKRHPEISLADEPPARWPESIPWNGGVVLVDPAIAGTDGYQLACFVKE